MECLVKVKLSSIKECLIIIMMFNLVKFSWHFLSLLSCIFPYKTIDNSTVAKSKPNIIYILADDLGYGDLSCYGQTKFLTPNIDSLSKEGMMFTQHYSGSTVCAPSRSALLTGMHTGHTFIRGNKEVKPEGQFPIPDSIYTLAELVKERGYVTGVFGKWGLGYPNSEGDPLKQGFDRFYGYNCQRLSHNYYPYHLWDNGKKIILQGNQDNKKEQYAPNLIHKEALRFIEENKNAPFFLFYPSIIPHAELAIPEEYLKQFEGKYNPEKEFKATDRGVGPREGKYESQKYPHAAFAAMIHLLDDQVGEIVNKVKELGLEDNTIIIFTSDNGPHKEGGADPEYFNSNGNLRGFKRDLYEGGIRVPMIVKWKGKVKEGTVSDHISAFWDILPTFAEIIDVKIKKSIDGISMLPELLQKPLQQQKHDYLYWEFHELGGRQAIRKDNWKLIRYNVDKREKYQLYNLEKDPSETINLAEQNQQLVLELAKILESSRTESKIFKF
jgi:arylsulfatase A-like enzyme